MQKVINYTKEQLERTTPEQREAIHKVSVLKEYFKQYSKNIEGIELNNEFFQTAPAEQIASYSISLGLNEEILLANMSLLNLFLEEKGFEVNAFPPSVVEIKDNKLYFKDESGTFVPIAEVFNQTIAALNAKNNENSQEK